MRKCTKNGKVLAYASPCLSSHNDVELETCAVSSSEVGPPSVACVSGILQDDLLVWEVVGIEGGALLRTVSIVVCVQVCVLVCVYGCMDRQVQCAYVIKPTTELSGIGQVSR